jgi:HSP20 family protein
MENEAFFENLAKGNDNEMGSYEVELTKAQTSSVASRSTKAAAQPAKEEDWDDGEAVGQLTVDVYQTPNDIVIESAIAGVSAEDIDVHVTSDSITIRGARRREKEVGDEDYLYQECYWGRFARSIILPQEVDPDNADVKFKHGILTIRLPKLNKKKTKKLRVRVE